MPVEWRHGDIFDVPFEAGSFDAVLSVVTLHHLSAERALVRFAGLIPPGGVSRSLDSQPTAGGTYPTLWSATVLGLSWA